MASRELGPGQRRFSPASVGADAALLVWFVFSLFPLVWMVLLALKTNAEQISTYLDQRHQDGMSLAEALKLAVQALSRDTNGTEREIPAERLEVAVLDRTRPQKRKFKRIVGRQLGRLLEAGGATTEAESAEEEE